ncbi:MAG TPA: ureidoglycolate lyase [Spirochaetia bacterium]|nr:ureidoglycolate lyase [Spirochaetia bacterium]
MREITWKKLTPDGFSAYGTYAEMLHPSGPHLGAEPIQFYRDMVLSHLGTVPVASFSVCRVLKRPFEMDVSEYHDGCCELAMPLDGDVLMHVAPAGPDKEFPFDQAEVFLVPKGTAVCIRPGVWHHAAFAHGCDAVNILCVLPERTYAVDCKVYPFPAGQHVKVTGPGTK